MSSELNFELQIFFLENYREIMDEINNHPEFKLGQNNHHLLSEKAKEVNNIFSFMNKLRNLISDLDKI